MRSLALVTLALLAWSPASAEPPADRPAAATEGAKAKAPAGKEGAEAKAPAGKEGAKPGARAPAVKAPAAKAPAAKAPGAKAPASPEAAARAAAGTGQEPSAAPPGAQRLDLTPSRLFGADSRLGVGSGGPERRSGVPLGDDGSWKVHAVQAGAMAVGFAALVALCKSGGCMLPSVLGEPDIGPSPDLQIREPAQVRSAR